MVNTKTLARVFVVLALVGLKSNALLAQPNGRYSMPVFSEVVTTKKIPYSSAVREGVSKPATLYLDFYEPSGDTVAARPLVITVFGGAFVLGSREVAGMVEYCTRLAEHGYATASIDYRLLPLTNISASGIIRDAYMAAQDISSAVRFFKTHHEEYRIDTTQVFLLGSSAGAIAILSEMFMDEEERPKETLDTPNLGSIHSSGFPEYANRSPKVAGAILHWGGVTNLNVIDSAEYAPLCMIHGTNDKTVPFNSGYCFSPNRPSSLMPYMYGSMPIAAHLDSIGISDYELHPFEGEKHAFYTKGLSRLNQKKFDACFGIVRDFLFRHLKSPKS